MSAAGWALALALAGPMPLAPPPAPQQAPEVGWLNGASRRTQPSLRLPGFTPQVDLDLNATFSSRRPIDDTVVGSTALARNGELQLSQVALGGDLQWGRARGRLMLQLGTRSTVVPGNDLSVQRGQYDLRTAYRHLSEASVGLRWDVLEGINLDAGLFTSYIGLFSYYNFENWAYQPSFTSDNTPWFFNGLRLQACLSRQLKVEGWLVNGWQSYAKYNRLPGLGGQLSWRPQPSLAYVANAYAGTDTPLRPRRLRLHLDQSLQWRYRQRPAALWQRAAVSLTVDVGGEEGDGASLGSDAGRRQRFVSAMLYHRAWFWRERLAVTVGGGSMHNPGRYLLLTPPGAAADLIAVQPGLPFAAHDLSLTFDVMPNEALTCRLELVHRRASLPYFAGPGGVTSPSGLASADPHLDGSAWRPQLVPSESRLILAMLARF